MIDTDLLRRLPKAELHLHIEGSLTPERLFDRAAKHGVTLPYEDTETLNRAYDFEDLQAFLDLYYAGCDVLRDEEDFYLLTSDYLEVCKNQNIVRVEIGFDPQAHMERGVPFEVCYRGIMQALTDAEAEWGLSHGLTLNLVRHMPEDDALRAIDAAEQAGAEILAVGLDSSEAPFPPSLFKRAFERARALGWRAIAHAGEEGPPSYIWSALNNLGIERIDHGVRCDEDEELVTYLADERIPLTVCPLSNVRLCVYDRMSDHNILKLLERGLLVTVNSDDPTYFGGFLEENYLALAQDLAMTDEQVVRLVRNGFEASFASDAYKTRIEAEISAAL